MKNPKQSSNYKLFVSLLVSLIYGPIVEKWRVNTYESVGEKSIHSTLKKIHLQFEKLQPSGYAKITTILPLVSLFVVVFSIMSLLHTTLARLLSIISETNWL